MLLERQYSSTHARFAIHAMANVSRAMAAGGSSSWGEAVSVVGEREGVEGGAGASSGSCTANTVPPGDDTLPPYNSAPVLVNWPPMKNFHCSCPA